MGAVKPRIGRPAKKAGGLAAVLSSLNLIFARLGLIRGVRLLFRMNQPDGFDCPGCAWPDPKDCSVVEFCENGVKAIAEEAMPKTIGREFFKRYSVPELYEQSDYWLGQQGRIVEPLFKAREASSYSAISWKEAFDLVAKRLQALESPDQSVFYTSGRTSNEAAFLYQLFVRKWGTNNLPDCSNMCHESSGVGLTETVGIGKGTVQLADFEKTELIFVIGQNPGTNHPRMLSAMQTAVRNGAKIITINPLREAGSERFSHPQEVLGLLGNSTRLSTLHLPVRINGDVPLLQAIGKSLLENHPESLDTEFLNDSTEGFEDYKKLVEGLSFEDLAKNCMVDLELIHQAAKELANAKSVIFCWAMGLTQHKNAVDNIQEIVNLALLRGQVGKPGAGLCPVRGHSNVQGDRTMGIYEKPSAQFLDRLAKNFQFDPPREPGFDTVDSIHAMRDSQVKVFFAMGGNFLSATPDTNKTKKAMENCPFHVQVSTKLNRSHLLKGVESLILPCLGRSDQDLQKSGEQFVSVENSMSVVHSSQGRLKPLSENLLSEVDIVCRLANSVLGEDWSSYVENYDVIRDLIENTIDGFEDYNQRVRIPGGFVLPNPPRDERRFATASGKAHFTLNETPSFELGHEEFLMMTIRSHDQYNTTVYGLDDRYRGVRGGRKVIFVNPEDFEEHKLSSDKTVTIESEYDGNVRVAEGFTPISYEIPKRCVATYFPEANAVIPSTEFARKSQTPISKSVRVRLRC